MRIWLITVGEPLPLERVKDRLWRTGLLAEMLAARGHEVLWWTSRVDHFRKRFFATDGESIEPHRGLSIRFLDGRLYRRNVSIARLVNHWQIGRAFAAQCGAAGHPDVILCSFPTIELSLEAVRFARRCGVPVVLDVRDLWPDIFVQAAPRFLRGLVRMLLSPYFVAARHALSGADALIAVSAGYLKWGLARAGRGEEPGDQVVPLAYSLPELTPLASSAGREMRRKLGVKDDIILCLFAGTLGRTYDLAPVLECANRLVRSGPMRFHFLICGDGDRAAEWRGRAAELPNVSFTGWLGQDDMRNALAAADLGLAAYAAGAPQGVPNKIIEYLAGGLPVISSLKGETEELLSDAACGTTYQAGNAESFENALKAFEPSDARRRAGVNARRTFEERFQAERVYGHLAEYLEALAHGAPGDAPWAGLLRGGNTG